MFGINTTRDISKLSHISLRVTIPNITANNVITHTNVHFHYPISDQTQNLITQGLKNVTVPSGRLGQVDFLSGQVTFKAVLWNSLSKIVKGQTSSKSFISHL